MKILEVVFTYVILVGSVISPVITTISGKAGSPSILP